MMTKRSPTEAALLPSVEHCRCLFPSGWRSHIFPSLFPRGGLALPSLRNRPRLPIVCEDNPAFSCLPARRRGICPNYFDACRSGDESHSLIWTAVSSWLAFLKSISRSLPRRIFCARCFSDAPSCARRSGNDSICLKLCRCMALLLYLQEAGAQYSQSPMNAGTRR